MTADTPTTTTSTVSCAAATPSENQHLRFEKQRHILYFKRCLQLLPDAYAAADTNRKAIVIDLIRNLNLGKNRMTLAYFALSGLDLLGALEDVVDADTKREYIDWIYSQQVLPIGGRSSGKGEAGIARDLASGKGGDAFKNCGFRGSTAFGQKYCRDGQPSTDQCDRANVAMTYTALISLLILGDDLSRVDRTAVIGAFPYLQQEDGSFAPVHESRECDLRFLYCACVVSYILDDWSGIDVPKAKGYIRNCLTFDFGISQAPGLESHGGSTYCGVAAFSMMMMIEDKDRVPLPRDKLVLWMLRRQGSGFAGRVNKPEDTCYSFWIGAALDILDASTYLNREANTRFLHSTQTQYGGFGKWAGMLPDLLHSYMGVAAFGLMRHPDVKALDPILNISQHAAGDMKCRNIWWKFRKHQ